MAKFADRGWVRTKPGPGRPAQDCGRGQRRRRRGERRHASGVAKRGGRRAQWSEGGRTNRAVHRCISASAGRRRAQLIGRSLQWRRSATPACRWRVLVSPRLGSDQTGGDSRGGLGSVGTTQPRRPIGGVCQRQGSRLVSTARASRVVARTPPASSAMYSEQAPPAEESRCCRGAVRGRSHRDARGTCRAAAVPLAARAGAAGATVAGEQPVNFWVDAVAGRRARGRVERHGGCRSRCARIDTGCGGIRGDPTAGTPAEASGRADRLCST